MQGMTLFTGFGGADLGMAAAGVEMVAGIEIDPAIAAVARANGIPVTVADVNEIDIGDYVGIEALHASPPCPNFSLANSARGETEQDIALARSVSCFIQALRPQVFTLENVWLYRLSQSWRMIEDTLFRMGYLPDVQLVNAADYGVPQTRKRMIVRAIRREMVPPLPEPEPWVGWYAAIEDLIPTLPESRFAPWQLARLPAELQTVLVHPTDQRTMPVVDRDEPAFTVVSNQGNGNMPRALLVNTNRSGDDGAGIVCVEQGEPAFTTKPADGGRLRAFLVDGKLSSTNGEKSLQIKSDHQPSATVVSSPAAMRDVRALLSQGRVVKMTPRALARFQSIPDSYELPDSNTLACKGIGNACPPRLIEAIYRGFRFLNP